MGLFCIGVTQEESNLFNEMCSPAVESVENWKSVFQIQVYLIGCRPRLSASETTKERQSLCSSHEETCELKGTLMHIPVATSSEAINLKVQYPELYCILLY